MKRTSAILLAGLVCGVPRGAHAQQQQPAERVPLGGPTTVQESGLHAFSFPLRSLDAGQRRAFSVGNAFFKDNWVAAPASAAGRDGLGPLFNARSCSSCHLRDGRGRPPREGESEFPGLLLRVGVADPAGGPDRPHPDYGVQLQDGAIGGVRPEVRVRHTGSALAGQYGEGEPFELWEPRYELSEAAYGALGEEARLGARVAPQLIGLGLLEALPAQAVIEAADPEDDDGDGISGRAHLLPDGAGGWRLGRFGWKATQASVREQVAAAFVHDMGITSDLFPAEVLTASQAAKVEFVSGGEPELDAHKLDRVSFYCQVLAVPGQRAAQDEQVLAGERLFERFGCVACHTPVWTTGADAPLPQLAEVAIRPYTDLLLHDLGEGLADQKHDGQARPAEWRTPPLWGIGLFEAVNDHSRYLHDGRARNLAEAVLWHGGEAHAAREQFRLAAPAERAALLAFLRSL